MKKGYNITPIGMFWFQCWFQWWSNGCTCSAQSESQSWSSNVVNGWKQCVSSGPWWSMCFTITRHDPWPVLYVVNIIGTNICFILYSEVTTTLTHKKIGLHTKVKFTVIKNDIPIIVVYNTKSFVDIGVSTKQM